MAEDTGDKIEPKPEKKVLKQKEPMEVPPPSEQDPTKPGGIARKIAKYDGGSKDEHIYIQK